MKKALLFGFGTIGHELLRQAEDKGVKVEYIIRFGGIFDTSLQKVGEQKEWKNFSREAEVVFIAVPSMGKGETALEYERYFLEKKIPVISCEKASIANNFDFLKQHKSMCRYTASVGGGTRMLNEISKYPSNEIYEIQGVMNGTLNYIGDSIKKGKTKEEVVKEVLENGFAEPGFVQFDEIIASELRDVCLKTVIIANYSGIFERVITMDDVDIVSNFDHNKRCIVSITREKITAGFIEDTNAEWLPEGVNNVLKINGNVVCGGPGAGAKATVETMFFDFESLL